MTIAEALEQWFELSRSRWAHSTSVGYRHAIDRHLAPHLGAHPVDRLTIAHVEHWQHHLRTDGLSNSTIRQARIVLRQALDMLVRHGLLASNPVPLAAHLPKGAVEPDFLTQAEAAAVIAAATDPVDRARWLLALTLGLRSGEVLGLRWDDLDIDVPPARLTITGSLQFQAGNGLVRVAPKTPYSRRTVLLNDAHVEVLRTVRSEQAKQRLADADDFNPDNYVFVTRRGTPIDTNNDSKRWHHLLTTAGVRQVRRHDARHTAATLMMNAGAGLANVQKMLGHSSIRTTVDVYGHLVAADSAPFTAIVTDAMTASAT
jgi:integrase